MKKALLIGLAIIGCSLLAGCNYENTKYRQVDVDVFDYGNNQNILVDKETGVQSIYLSGHGYSGLSDLLDADGKPMVDKQFVKQD